MSSLAEPGCACVVRVLTVSLLLMLGLCSCSGKAIDLGRDPEILWWTDHETGDLSDWHRGANSSWLAYGGTLAVDTQQARSGRYSLDAQALAAPKGTTSAAMLLRTGDLPQAAYYSAWFYLPTSATSFDYWLIFKFRSRTPDPNPVDVELWDIDLTSQGSELELRVFHHASTADGGIGSEIAPATPLAVPRDRWFQVEAYLRAAPDDTGELVIWQDGNVLYDIHGPSAPSAYLQWSVGSAAESLGKGVARAFVDDAAISLRELGPDTPPFWRGE